MAEIYFLRFIYYGGAYYTPVLHTTPTIVNAVRQKCIYSCTYTTKSCDQHCSKLLRKATEITKFNFPEDISINGGKKTSDQTKQHTKNNKILYWFR